MNFSWSLPDELDVEWTDARRILSLYRMLQESVSNAVRHSNAKNLAIEFEETLVDGAAHVKVVIEDDGIGFDTSERIAGRGLTNLKSRAKQMGGTIAIAKPASGSGTRIEISLPAKQDEGQLPIMSVK
jgi:signal transduction histidine kinase